MLKDRLIKSNRYSVKSPYEMVAEGIVIHNTANDASARNEADYMERNNNQVSFHIVVDDKEALKLIPFNRNSWHAGDGGSGKGNRRYLALEICYSKSGGSRFVKAEDNAAKVVADILKEKGWGIDKVKAHRDFSNKNCPHRTDMKSFKDKVAKYLKGNTPNPSTNLKVGDKVEIVGAYYATGQEVSSWAKKNIHTIAQIKGDKALLQTINSWCYLKDIKLSGNTTDKKELKVGDTVKMNGSKWATGERVASWVKNNKYRVRQIKGDRALLDDVISWAYIKDLEY